MRGRFIRLLTFFSGLYFREMKVSMKKLFVSLPMNGRSEEDIRAEQEYLLNVVNSDICEGVPEFELIDTFVQDNPPVDSKYDRAFYLGNSIAKLALADLVIFSSNWRDARGCIIEHMACSLYEIPYVEVSKMDIFEELLETFPQVDMVVDYTHNLEEQPIEIVNTDIYHDDFSEKLAEPQYVEDPYMRYEDEDDDIDALEPGEYDADAVSDSLND